MASQSWPVFTSTTSNQRPPLLSSTASDFLVAIITAGISIYKPSDLRVHKPRYPLLGIGGFATVKQGKTFKGEIVAVKQCRLWSQPSGQQDIQPLDKELHQICLELRILSHGYLREHPNIINILGICLDEASRQPDISLVLEYSSHGTLKSFLVEHHDIFPDETLVNFALQVSRGIAALHHLRICHGDIKTQNALVFFEDDAWVVKVSDFGQSVVGAVADSSTTTTCNIGTRLMNAPEIRSGAAFADPLYNIEAAMSTDTFSFGLLTWEVMKKGQCYFEKSWMAGSSGPIDTDLMEDYLKASSHNEVLNKGIQYLENRDMDSCTRTRIMKLLCGSLQDFPCERESMSQLVEILDTEAPTDSDGSAFMERWHKFENLPLCAWTPQDSLTELYSAGKYKFIQLFLDGYSSILGIDDIPFSLQKLIFSQLKSFATSSTVSPQTRESASICVSECYVFGFGVDISVTDAVFWLHHAAQLESPRAIAWYGRVCVANKVNPVIDEHTIRSQRIEEQLSRLPPELYLTARIRSQVHRVNQEAQASSELSRANHYLSHSSDYYIRVAIFNNWEYDELTSLHLAALIGDNTLLTTLLQDSTIERLSKQGLSAVHYACIGGHLSTLEILVQSGAQLDIAGSHGITPLHLCIFFTPGETESAIKLLLEKGKGSDTETTTVVNWEYHDIALYGTAIDWGTLTRNRPLVRALLPHSRLESCLKIAIHSFFWDVADDILQQLRKKGEIPTDPYLVATVSRPIAHWIAHGEDHTKAIKRTVQICHDYGIFDSNNTPLTNLISQVKVEDDFALVNSCLSLSSAASLKRKDEDGEFLLWRAIMSAKNQNLWRKTLSMIVEYFTVKELQEDIHGFSSYLAVAVFEDSVVSARVLLERGIDVNRRTYYARGLPPMCRSSDMYLLLKDFKADKMFYFFPDLTRSPRDHTEIDWSESTLTGQTKEDYLGDLLHSRLKRLLFAKVENRQSGLQYFQVLLRLDNTAECINYVDEAGATLIHRATQSLDSDIVTWLLESGADASIAFTSGGTSLLPLQIACLVGRKIWAYLTVRGLPEGQNIRAKALVIASELLRWHHARGDSLFEGVTILHLASFLMMSEEVERLIAVGYNRMAKGRWPGTNHDVTPQELLSANLNDGASIMGTLAQSYRPVGDSPSLDDDFYDLLRLDYDFSDSDDSDTDFSGSLDLDPETLELAARDWDSDFTTSRDFVGNYNWDYALERDIRWQKLGRLPSSFWDIPNLQHFLILEVKQHWNVHRQLDRGQHEL